MTRLIQALRHNRLTLAKTASYYLIHITVVKGSEIKIEEVA